MKVMLEVNLVAEHTNLHTHTPSYNMHYVIAMNIIMRWWWWWWWWWGGGGGGGASAPIAPPPHLRI